MDRLLKNTRQRTTNLPTTVGFIKLRPIRIDSLLYADDLVQATQYMEERNGGQCRKKQNNECKQKYQTTRRDSTNV